MAVFKRKIISMAHAAMGIFFCMVVVQGCFKFRTSDTDAKKAFSQKGVALKTGFFAAANGRQLHYVQTGDSTAPTIYFIHGTPGSWDNFKNYLLDSALLQHFRLIAVDRPGFGYSNFGKSLPVAEQVRMLNEFVSFNKNGKPAILAGHSLGGPIVVAMAAADTAVAQTLLLLAASVSPLHEPAEKWRKALANPLLNPFVPGAFRPSNAELLDFKTYVNQMPALLRQVRCTTYIMHGTKDMFVPYGNLAYADSSLINAPVVNLITLPGENHFIPWTKFDDIRQLLLYMYNTFNQTSTWNP
ncbi:MAG: alpha/beta hydrolase [Chitinophagaceae bacterium]|nr:alpha/beta hydrolase [Chitinophagaceae bacterium]